MILHDTTNQMNRCGSMARRRRRIGRSSRQYRHEVSTEISSRLFRLGIPSGQSVFSLLLAVMLIVLVLVVPVIGKEIVATHEWQLLGENDTVAAGMHIRVDLSTGEKWVKIPEDESWENQSNERVTGSGSGHSLAIMTNEGDLQLVQSVEADEVEPNYDFDMMYRTLSKLPAEEQKRIQLPRLTSTSAKIASLEPEARAHFEARLKLIWEERQAELQRIQRENIMDMPQLLKDRIEAMRAYLADPVTHLKECLETTISEADSGSTTVVTNIIQVLQDLEYQLADLDMTRDFHTLGGWPLLAALLCDFVHPKAMRNGNVTNTDSDVNQLLREEIHRIQMYASWAMGTAVKNTGEFLSYVLEPLTVVDVTTSDTTTNDSNKDGSGTTSVTTALDLVLRQFRSTMATAAVRALTDAELQKLSKLVYCLGSFLRGNRPAQLHFVHHQGPSSLAAALKSTLSRLKDQTTTTTIALFYRKLAQRILQLASDTVLDVSLHATETTDLAIQSDDAQIVQSYTDAEWCDAVQLAFQSASDDSDNNINQRARLRVVEDVLPTVHTLLSQCGAHWRRTSFIHKLESLKENKSDEVHDGEVVDLIETTLRLLRDEE